MAFSPPVNKPESPSPSPSSRSYLPRIVDPAALAVESEGKFEPRYVEVPALRERGFGRRNLVWGVILLVLAIGLLVAAVIVSGQKAVLSLAACLLTFTALFVLSRLHIFRQRNGAFLAVAVVVLLGAVVPLIDRGYELLAGVSHPTGAATAAAPVPSPTEVEPPALMQAFALGKPDLAQTHVKVLKDSRVVIEGKPFLIKIGDAFPLLGMKGGEATFAVRDLQVALPVEVVEIVGGKAVRETKESAMAAALASVTQTNAPAPEQVSNPAPAEAAKPDAAAAELAAITRSAQAEAVRRYPALQLKDSKENEVFVTTYRQLKSDNDVAFFSNPEWPLVLAEQLATSQGWARGDQAVPAEAAPAQEAPAVAPAGDGALMDPQQLPQLPPSSFEERPQGSRARPR